MRKTMQKLFAALLAVCLVLALLPALVPAAQAAETTTASKRYNIMLVIDGSGSLETEDKTDPDRMRYELISDLLGNIEDDGHNLGAIVFSGNNTTQTSESAMESGIMLNTGILPLDAPSPDGRPTKDYIYNQIVTTGYDKTRNGTTDVGTAIRVAQRVLLQKQQENGLESLVFLFTDGLTDMHTTEQENISAANMTAATSEMNSNGIRLMGIFLNKNGKLKSEEIKGIVCASNGIAETSKEFSDSYVEIYDAASCHAAVNVMLRFLGYINDENPEPITGDLYDEFVIPGIGVEEMNIRLYSYDGTPLPTMTVELTRPDGTVLSGSELNALARIGRTFQVYKLVDPMPGKWILHVRVPENSNVRYCYDPVYNVQIDAGMDVSPEVSEWHVNKAVTFTGYLSQGGTVVTEPASYREYACTLVISDKVSGTSETFDIPNDGTGKFNKTLTLDKYGQHEAQILFTCDELLVASNTLEYLLENQAPTTDGTVKKRLSYGMFQQNTATLDLTPYYNDREDGKNVSVSIQNASCPSDAYTLTGTDLELKSTKLKNDTIDILVTDSQGATATLQLVIVSRNVTAGLVVLMIVILAILLVIAIVIAVILRSVRPMGSLSLTFTLNDEDENEHTASLYLGVPNANAPSNTTLGALLEKALQDETLLLDIDMDNQSAIDRLSEDVPNLRKIRVSSAIKLMDGKLTGAIKVVNGSEKVVLFDSTWSGRPDSIKYVLTFSLAKKRKSDSEMDEVLGEESSGGDFIEDSKDIDSLFS